MKLKAYFLTLVGLMAAQSMMAQANILNAKIPEEIGLKTEAQLLLDNDRPLEYGYVDDRDILFSKMTWEKVVLDERINFPLYYPVDTNNIGKDRRSLFDVLWKAVKKGEIENVYSDSYFTTKRTIEDLRPAMSKVDTLDIGYQQYNADGFVDLMVTNGLLNAPLNQGGPELLLRNAGNSNQWLQLDLQGVASNPNGIVD